MKTKLIVLALFFSLPVNAQKSKYNVTSFIEKTGKSILITKQLQELIDRCSDDGGGYVYFPAGEYLTGTIVLKNNTFLELSPGATLYGSTDISDYPERKYTSLIYANGAKNTGIIGEGTINGQGDFFWQNKPQPYIRPDRFILFENCNDVRIRNVSIINSPNWNVDLRFCDGVWIEGVSIISDLRSPNSDGIDPVSSKNVFISNCYIETGDDAICPKSRGNTPTENLVVTNCVLISDDTAIKLGTRSEADIKNAVFSNIVIRNSAYGIAFYAKDGGTYENIRFENIHIETMDNMQPDYSKASGTYPLFIDLETRSSKPKLGAVKNVFFNNITIDSPDGHCLFLGQPNSRLQNINLTNINFTVQNRASYEGYKKPRGVKSLKDKAPNDYAHISSHFTFAHIDGLKIDNLSINDKSDNTDIERHMLWTYDVHNIKLSNFSNKAKILCADLSQLKFNQSTNIEVRSSTPVGSPAPFIKLEGEKTSNVVLQNNNFLNLEKVVSQENNVMKDAVIQFNNLKH